jgi:hypothetical protein
MITERDLSRSVLFVAGVILLLLGAVNWILGMRESGKYQKMIHGLPQSSFEEDYRMFEELTPQQNEQLLSRLHEERANYNIARVRLDFFHVVLSGGRLLFLIGAILVSCFIIRIVRQESATRMRRITKAPEAKNRAEAR